MIRPRRSVLYMPGSNARALEKARTLDADAVILDLEDAVAPDQKALARENVCAAVRQGFGMREVVVRVNALNSPWGRDDLAAVVDANPDAVLIPKAESAAEIQAVDTEIAAAPIALWAMIETPRGVLRADAIAGAGGRLNTLVMGTNDLIKEMGARPMPDRANIAAALSFTVLAARAHGLGVIDGVHNDIGDADGFAAACAQGRAFGFDGKTVIHPSQIGPANAAFAPTTDDIAAAQTIIDAFARPENHDKGAIKLDGKMIERLHAVSAQRTLDLVAAIRARQP